MSSYEDFNKASKTVQKRISEAEEKIGETTRQVQNEWAKAFEEMSRTAMSRASAEMQLGLKLSQKLTACRSPYDAFSAYQEWLTEEMNDRSEAARHFMANCQKFFTESTRLLASQSNGWMSR
ncbi:MAG TPA: phasin family protein [Pseudolabrys sp.]|nr:phasin family protein [Pseudolabrys sp.]